MVRGVGGVGGYHENYFIQCEGLGGWEKEEGGWCVFKSRSWRWWMSICVGPCGGKLFWVILLNLQLVHLEVFLRYRILLK